MIVFYDQADFSNNSIVIPASTETFSSNLAADKGLPTPISSWSGAEHVSFCRRTVWRNCLIIFSLGGWLPRMSRRKFSYPAEPLPPRPPLFRYGGTLEGSGAETCIWWQGRHGHVKANSQSWSCILLPISICDLSVTEAGSCSNFVCPSFFSCKTWTGRAPASTESQLYPPLIGRTKMYKAGHHTFLPFIHSYRIMIFRCRSYIILLPQFSYSWCRFGDCRCLSGKFYFRKSFLLVIHWKPWKWRISLPPSLPPSLPL